MDKPENLPTEPERSCVRSYVDQELIDSLRREVSAHPDLEEHARMFAMLGDLTRLRILYCLSRTEELCVCDLSDILGMGVSAISHSLRKLKDRGLVKSRRDGLTIYYSLVESEPLRAACDLLTGLLAGRYTGVEL
jgi:DNA-binding transcriptional ArsR family regulator